MNKSSLQSRLLLFIKGFVSAAVLAIIISQIDFGSVRSILATIPPWALTAGFSAFLIQGFVLAWRWYRVIYWLGDSLGFFTTVHLTFIGLFFNQALPGSIGGDALRIWGAYRKGMASELALSSVAIERITGLASLALLITLALSQVWWIMGQSHARWFLLASAPLALLGLCILSVSDRLPLKWLPLSFTTHLDSFATGLRKILGNLVACAEIMFLGALSSVLAISQAFLVGNQIGIDLGFAAYILVLGGAVILTIIPISFAGWGVREAAVVGLFGLMGVPSDKALVVSLLFGLALTLSALPGGILWLLNGHKKLI